MKTLSYINYALALFGAVCLIYQAVYTLVSLVRRPKKYTAQKLCRYAVLIAARNEQEVIGNLLDSLARQSYPRDLYDVYVVADNCSDSTADVARAHGAAVFERDNKILVGKGYALGYLLEKLGEAPENSYDGYFVFDADNLLEPNYISEMNKVFSSGHRIVTGYRNSKNFSDNWISAGYGIYFLRESEHLNAARDALGVSCFVSGTGFLFADSVLREIGGWDYHLLTEDFEFTADMLVRGERITYCHDAVLYDEQPTKIKPSLIQRARWIKGYFQVLAAYGSELLKTLAGTGSFACYDLMMSNISMITVTVLGFIVNTAMFFIGIMNARREMDTFFFSVASIVVNSYFVTFISGLLVYITERKRINCPRKKRLLYMFTYPFFLGTFGFAMLMALFGTVSWQPIRHTVALSIGDIDKKRRGRF